MANNISISTTMFLTFIFIGTLFQSSRVASQIGVYWGQHHGEGSIKDACDSLINYTTINIAFLSTFGCGRTPKLDLAHCDASRGGCRHLGSEIQGCQDKVGSFGQRLVSVFLSIGGDGYGEYSLSSATDAKQVAAYLWNNYLGGNSTSRPFGDVVLDGIEFNIQKGSNRYWDVLLRELRSYSDELLLVGSPSCSYPDYYLNRAITTGEFNYLWVRFYNDHSCQYNPYRGIEDVLDTWTRWSTITYNFDGVVYLSLPACSEAAPYGGYIPPYVLNQQVLPRLREDVNYGGVILWDRYYDATTNYSAKISPYVGLNLAKSSS